MVQWGLFQEEELLKKAFYSSYIIFLLVITYGIYVFGVELFNTIYNVENETNEKWGKFYRKSLEDYKIIIMTI